MTQNSTRVKHSPSTQHFVIYADQVLSSLLCETLSIIRIGNRAREPFVNGVVQSTVEKFRRWWREKLDD